MVPVPLICAVTQLASRALYDGAFKNEGFKSLDDILDSPNLENVDYLTLAWKEEMLDRPIIPIDYYRYLQIWHKTILAAGFRDDLRPYSLRVGAGARLGESLSCLSNTFIY
ncbi:DUF3435 domain-containing protein [Halomonas organivorans]|uniref:DUF3435 domain-containing protein n=1 Tax=Halomonas organivorans TaxID=257772 RepID=UPI003636D269